jgi:hypothetical protein
MSPLRDALALVQARLRGDDDGRDAILGNCDLPRVSRVLARLTADLLRGVSPDPEAAVDFIRTLLAARESS